MKNIRWSSDFKCKKWGELLYNFFYDFKNKITLRLISRRWARDEDMYKKVKTKKVNRRETRKNTPDFVSV